MEQVTLQESNSKYAEKVNNNDCFDFTNLWEKLLSMKAKENMTLPIKNYAPVPYLVSFNNLMFPLSKSFEIYTQSHKRKA